MNWAATHTGYTIPPTDTHGQQTENFRPITRCSRFCRNHPKRLLFLPADNVVNPDGRTNLLVGGDGLDSTCVYCTNNARKKKKEKSPLNVRMG